MTTTGITGGLIRPSIQINIDCMHCDKHGNKKIEMILTDVCHLKGSRMNLLILSRMMKQGWKMAATEESITMKKEALKICFDLVIPTKHDTLYCAYFSHTGEVQGGALTNRVQMSIAKANAILGHVNELATRKTAKYLG